MTTDRSTDPSDARPALRGAGVAVNGGVAARAVARGGYPARKTALAYGSRSMAGEGGCPLNGAELAKAVDRLVRQVGHWTPVRWSARTGEPGDATRAEVVYALVQRLADAAADAEGEPRRAVPRLDNQSALVDQLRVVAADLAAAGSPEALVDAAADVAAVQARL